MKNLILGILLSMSPAHASQPEGVNPQITDSSTSALQASLLERKLGLLDRRLGAQKIAESDVPDNMLFLLAALRASTQYVGVRNSDVPDNLMSALRQEARDLLVHLRNNPEDAAALEKAEYINLNPTLDAVLKGLK